MSGVDAPLGQQGLHLIPEGFVHDRLMVTIIDRALMGDLATIDGVSKQLAPSAAAEPDATPIMQAFGAIAIPPMACSCGAWPSIRRRRSLLSRFEPSNVACVGGC